MRADMSSITEHLVRGGLEIIQDAVAVAQAAIDARDPHSARVSLDSALTAWNSLRYLAIMPETIEAWERGRDVLQDARRAVGRLRESNVKSGCRDSLAQAVASANG